ncbi:hypothetical protein [Lundtoftevirus Lu221]|uniref:Uncharacterized protein n=1 Tax=phage PKM.Lu.22.1 TaxID=3049197 RepID=A0AAF0RBE1_9CAUD|nr:hypothetical protein [phage PKM.Lu.22.1]
MINFLRKLFRKKERNLQDFLYQYYHIHDSLKPPEWVDFHNGLCSNSISYSSYYGLRSNTAIMRQLINLFKEDNLDPDFPFGSNRYLEDQNYRKHHLNLHRLEWIKDTLKNKFGVKV